MAVQFGDKQGWVTPLTSNSATPLETLGIRRVEVDEDGCRRVYAYVKNGEASQGLVDGDICKVEDLEESEVKRGAAQGDVPAGVAIGALTASNYGWIQVQGLHKGIKCHGDTAVGDSIEVAGDGVGGRTAKNTAPTNQTVAWAITAEADDKCQGNIVLY